jgi:3-dehydrosphinganine reductase
MAAALLLMMFPPACLLAALAFLARPRAARIPLEGRHVFISGGSSGIGLAIATAAAREGARVSILARDAARLEEARVAIQRGSGRGDVVVRVHAADVRDAGAVARALREAGPVDVLVCNHGVFASRELVNQDVEEMKGMVDTNLTGTLHLVKAALPAMKARTRETGLPASIAIMSSQAGQVELPARREILRSAAVSDMQPSTYLTIDSLLVTSLLQVGIYGYAAYSASKFALRGLGEALQHEVTMDNVHVSLIFPPDTETPGLQKGMCYVWL